jgi:PKD repeat protein
MNWFPTVLFCIGVWLTASHAAAADRLKVVVVDGDEAANIVADRLAAEPVIEVRDRENRRVPGAVVRFAIRKTRDRIIAAFANGQSEVRTITDVSGRASVNAVTPLESGGFQIDVEVSYRGDTGKAVIRQTNFGTSADAKAAGREPGKSSNSNAQNASGNTGSTASSGTAATTGATAAAAAGTAGATATTAAATTAAVAAGGGMSKLAVIGLVAGGAAGAGAAVVLTKKEPSAPPPTVSAMTLSQTAGVQSGSRFRFSVQATGFDAGSLAYRWEFGDGETSTEPAPTHVYHAAGTFAVVVTVRDARQSQRAESSVQVFSVTGNWATSNGQLSLQLTQAGDQLAGASTFVGRDVPFVCALSGSVVPPPGEQSGSTRIILRQPLCVYPDVQWVQTEYDLGMAVGGQTLSGTRTQGAGSELVQTDQIVLQRR